MPFLNPFPRPAGAMDPKTLSDITRGNDNLLVQVVNATGGRTTTESVSTTATTIAPAVTDAAAALVTGSTGTAAFVDLVVWHGSGSASAATSTTVKGSPAARTYTVSSGALQLAMASGTYTVTTMRFVFTT